MAGNCFALRFGLTCMSRKHHRFVKQLTANSLSGNDFYYHYHYYYYCCIMWRCIKQTNQGMTCAFSSGFISKLEGDDDRWEIDDCKAQTRQFGPNTVGEKTIQAVSGKRMVLNRQNTASVTFKL